MSEASKNRAELSNGLRHCVHLVVSTGQAHVLASDSDALQELLRADSFVSDCGVRSSEAPLSALSVERARIGRFDS